MPSAAASSGELGHVGCRLGDPERHLGRIEERQAEREVTLLGRPASSAHRREHVGERPRILGRAPSVASRSARACAATPGPSSQPGEPRATMSTSAAAIAASDRRGRAAAGGAQGLRARRGTLRGAALRAGGGRWEPARRVTRRGVCAGARRRRDAARPRRRAARPRDRRREPAGRRRPARHARRARRARRAPAAAPAPLRPSPAGAGGRRRSSSPRRSSSYVVIRSPCLHDAGGLGFFRHRSTSSGGCRGSARSCSRSCRPGCRARRRSCDSSRRAQKKRSRISRHSGLEPREALADDHRLVEPGELVVAACSASSASRAAPGRRAQQVEAAVSRQLADPRPDRRRRSEASRAARRRA